MGSFLSFFKVVVVVVCLFFTFFTEEAIFLSLKDALHLILSLRDFEFQSSYHITRKKRFLPLGTSENNYRKIHIPGMFLTLPPVCLLPLRGLERFFVVYKDPGRRKLAWPLDMGP